MFFVVGHLNGAPPFRFRDGLGHRIGHVVGVEQGNATDVPSRTANGLDQGAFRPQKAFFVGIQDRHQGDLRQIQAFPQQVDAHQDVVLAVAQVLNDLDALNGVNLRVHVAHLDLVFGQVVAEVFGHALGERGHQHPLVALSAHANLTEQVIHLPARGPHLNDGIEHPGGANHLLRHLAIADLHLPVTRRGADKDGLFGFVPELSAFQRAVVGSTGKPEAMVDQHLLARAVAVVHGLQLRAGDMAFINHQAANRRGSNRSGTRGECPLRGQPDGGHSFQRRCSSQPAATSRGRRRCAAQAAGLRATCRCH